MASGENGGFRMLEPLICDAIPGPPPSMPKPDTTPIAAAEFDAHHQHMLSSDLLDRFYRLIRRWHAGQVDDNTLRELTSIRKTLQSRGKDPGACEEHGDPGRLGPW
jgi:hypothetical protein